ncbi:hypothetical protein D3C81_1282430 [compost metagenome]
MLDSGASTYSALLSNCATPRWFASLASMKRLASRTLITRARAALGYCSTKARVAPSTFSGWSGQIVWLVARVKPMSSSIARAPHGLPAQKPSIRPARRCATICEGGTTRVFTSRSGWMPWLASQ